MGALMILVKRASTLCADSVRGELPATQARLVLSMRGIPAAELDLVFGALQLSGHIVIDGDQICVNAVAGAYEAEANLLAIRKAGWEKRLNTSVGGQHEVEITLKKTVKKVTKAPSNTHNNGKPVPSLVEAPVVPETKLLTKRFASSDALSTDPEIDPIMARLRCDGGRVAEITQDYVAALQPVFGDVDILTQMKLMANWLESNPSKRKTFTGLRRFINAWLRNASSAASMRRDLIKSASQRNGFGSGGVYPHEADPKNVSTGDFDDLTDLLEERAKENPPAAVSSIVAAARHRATYLRATRISQSNRSFLS